MRRAILALAPVVIVLSLILGVFSAAPTRLKAQGSLTLLGVGGSGAPSSCSQATTFLARTSGLSGTLSTAYTNLICSGVTHGWYTSCPAYYILATSTVTTAELNLISTSFGLTPHGTLTFTANTGWQGDGSTGYADSGYNPSSSGGGPSQSSLMIGYYDLSNRTSTVSFTTDMGADNGSIYIYLQGQNPSGQFSTDLNDGSFSAATNTFGTAKGLWLSDRTSSTNINLRRNGTPVTSFTATSNPAPNFNIALLGLNNSGTTTQFSPDQYSAFWICPSLGATNDALLETDTNTFMTALGKNVY